MKTKTPNTNTISCNISAQQSIRMHARNTSYWISVRPTRAKWTYIHRVVRTQASLHSVHI